MTAQDVFVEQLEWMVKTAREGRYSALDGYLAGWFETKRLELAKSPCPVCGREDK